MAELPYKPSPLETESTHLEDDRLYEAQVLQLQDGRTEHDLDEQYLQDALNLGVRLGIDKQHEPLSKPQPSRTSSATTSHSRRCSVATSGESHWSSSTALTSNLSQHSKEYTYTPSSPIPLPDRTKTSLRPQTASPTPISPSPTSPSLYGALPNFPTHRISIPSPYSPTSPRSLSARLSYRFSRFKRSSLSNAAQLDATACRLCPRHVAHDSPTHRLRCKHSLCEKHIRPLINDSDERIDPEVLECCARAIPWEVAQAVLTKYAHKGGTERQSQNDDPPRSRQCSTRSGSTFHPLEQERCSTSHSRKSSAAETRQLSERLEQAMLFPDFRSLRRQQESERDRFLEHRKTQRAQVQTRYDEQREKLDKSHREAETTLLSSQPVALSVLEDRHISTELELHEAHKTESFNCLVALRHMENYCRGHDPDGTGRVVTLEDRVKLERQYYLWRGLKARQEAAIHVLRETQARQMNAKSLRQISDHEKLQGVQEAETHKLEEQHAAETGELDGTFAARKERLVKRWNLATETWKGWREKDEDIAIPWPVAPVEWPQD